MVKKVSYRVFLGSLVATTGLSAGGMYVYMDNQTEQTQVTTESQGELSKVQALYELLQTSYYQKVDTTALIDGALKGMTDSLDDP